jgi:DNA-binding HxlR family transcriptional regulator/putative sterol carrier protein
MGYKRTYGDVCGVARALDVVGERWALLVVRELLLGPKRFTDLRVDLPHLSPDVLTQRLRDLGAAGIVRKRRLPPPAASQVYELTDLGAELEPVVMALGRWGSLLPVPTGEMAMSFDAHILSLRTLFDPERADGLRARVQLRLGEQRFHAEVADERFEIERGEAAAPDATLTSDADTLLAVAHGRRELDEAVRAGALAIEGDEQVGARFLGLFPLPECALEGQPA